MKLTFFYKSILSLFLGVGVYQIQPAYAQSDRFSSYLNVCKLSYQQPKSYTAYSELDYNQIFTPNYPDGTFILSLIFYAIKNDQKDILIGFAPMQIFETDKESLTYKIFPADINKNWLVDIHVEADTSVTRPAYFGKEQLNVLNADNAALYQLKMKRTFLEKYTYCKVVIIHKEHVSDAQIFYFYNDSSKDVVDDQIRATNGVLKFKAD
jgi:hypothetical protein